MNAENQSAVDKICTWLDNKNWQYEYQKPLKGGHDLHHIIVEFADEIGDWTCVFRVDEKTQLVAIYGVLHQVVPVDYFTSVLMAFAKLNTSVLYYGHLQLDPSDGEVWAKLAYDGEFTQVSDKALDCFVQAVMTMVEIARTTLASIMMDDTPSQFAGDYLDTSEEEAVQIDGHQHDFFVPTERRQ